MSASDDPDLTSAPGFAGTQEELDMRCDPNPFAKRTRNDFFRPPRQRGQRTRNDFLHPPRQGGQRTRNDFLHPPRQR